MDTGDELREYARCEGGAFLVCDPTDARWSWHEADLDVKAVIDTEMVKYHLSREKWLGWLAEEIAYGHGGDGYMESMAEAMQVPAALPPVIVAFHPNGRVEIGDGWHRLAIAVRDGIVRLPAVIGRCPA